MASYLKAKFQNAVSPNEAPTPSDPITPPNGISSASSTASQSSETEAYMSRKYVLRVTAGPSYDPSTHTIVPVNSSEPATFSNDFMHTSLKVNILNYEGLPVNSPAKSPYFDHPLHKSDRYSIAFSFVPKQNLPAKDVVWGNDFDHPVRDRLPPGFNTAFKIVKEFIDPGLECDAYADEPWLYGHALSCWLAFRIGEKGSLESGSSNESEAVSEEKKNNVLGQSEADVVQEGGDGDGLEVRRQLGIPDDAQKRRKHFLKDANREAFTFEQGRTYHGDFFNPYLDFQKFSLRLPGFSISVLKYINDKSHKLRYVFKNRQTGEVYFVVIFTLLFGDELKDTLES